MNGRGDDGRHLILGVQMAVQRWGPCNCTGKCHELRFVFSEEKDCSIRESNFDKCIKWRREKDEKAFNELTKSEIMRKPVSDDFRANFERMQEVENLENELRVFFGSFERGLEALKNFEVRRNTFKFLDQYGTIADILKIDLLRLPSPARSLVPEYLEERIRNQAKWFRGDDDFSLDFAKEFLRRKFCTMRSSFKAPQPTSLLPPVPPPRRNRTGSVKDPQPSTSQVMSAYTASGRLRRNSAPTTISPPKPRRMTAEELPSPPPTPPPLREEVQEIRIAQVNELNNEFVEEEAQGSRDGEAQLVPSTSPARPVPGESPNADQAIPDDVIDDVLESNNNTILESESSLKTNEDQPAVKAKIKNPVISEVDRPLQETAM